jgi:hypothetical protein
MVTSNYVEVLIKANELIKDKYGSINNFAKQAKIRKKNGKYYSVAEINNLLAIPANSREKKLKSFHLLKEVLAAWKIKAEMTKYVEFVYVLE